jgi:chemotaxis-related protein WspB
VVPVLDLHRLVGAGEAPPHLSTRIILVPRPFEGGERLVGLLAARVDDVRALSPSVQDITRLASTSGPDLGPVLVDDGGLVHLVELDRLMPESYERQLTLVSRELPA